jgi:hypothetical protein
MYTPEPKITKINNDFVRFSGMPKIWFGPAVLREFFTCPLIFLGLADYQIVELHRS